MVRKRETIETWTKVGPYASREKPSGIVAWAVSGAGVWSVAKDGVASNRRQKASGRSAENNVTVKSWLEGPAGSGYFPVIGATAQAGLGTIRSGGLSTKLYPALTDRFCQVCGAVDRKGVVEGKGVAVRVDLGGCLILQKKKSQERKEDK